ncbi:universal stress protein [Geitlerinema sp. PCC 7407]|uniref:universal stress protein n=1 Tax=Geitlerinema sp. PCC 7407 TaxID=1173025 RepID=UPI00029FA0ED|nr:universal stress protein [Geitlerinema sp. PCC 7407]AFY68030.1 UspA domain-containing protein [Geitlerinema sp. PCC 7407]
MTQTLPLVSPLLVATDGSPSALLAQRLVYPLASVVKMRDREPVLHCLTVEPRPSRRRAAEAEPPDPEEASGEAAPTASQNAVLEAIAADLPADLSVSLQVRQGRPANEILRYARRTRPGLIALGQHGVGGVRELLLGSVSSAIARYADCPILIARHPETEAPTEARWQRILLVVNGFPATKQAIALTRQILPIGVQHVSIFCVQPPLTSQYLFGPFATPTPNSQLTLSLQQVQHEQSEQLIHQAEAALADSGIDVSSQIQIGEPGPLICQLAQHHQSDLIIVGSDRRPAFRNIRLNATGDYLIHHAPCPVLLCRNPQNDTAHPAESP